MVSGNNELELQGSWRLYLKIYDDYTWKWKTKIPRWHITCFLYHFQGSHEYIDIATSWFGGLINRDIKVINEVYALRSIDFQWNVTLSVSVTAYQSRSWDISNNGLTIPTASLLMKTCCLERKKGVRIHIKPPHEPSLGFLSSFFPNWRNKELSTGDFIASRTITWLLWTQRI